MQRKLSTFCPSCMYFCMPMLAFYILRQAQQAAVWRYQFNFCFSDFPCPYLRCLAPQQWNSYSWLVIDSILHLYKLFTQQSCCRTKCSLLNNWVQDHKASVVWWRSRSAKPHLLLIGLFLFSCRPPGSISSFYLSKKQKNWIGMALSAESWASDPVLTLYTMSEDVLHDIAKVD